MSVQLRRLRKRAQKKIRCGWSISQLMHFAIRKHRHRIYANVIKHNALLRHLVK